MIKLTRISSEKENPPKIFVLAGGPGLSTLTLRDLDLLKRSFELNYIDLQATNGSEYHGKKSFSELCALVGGVINRESGKKYIFGHSYGGFLAAGILAQVTVAEGLICISTPFSKDSLNAANENYRTHNTASLDIAKKLWEEKQDNASFVQWLSEYGELYFKNQKGKKLILNDRVSSQFFKDNRSDILKNPNVINELAKINVQKIFITGVEDKLLPSNILKKDATDGGFEFFEIKGASHFVTLDQPEMVAGLIESQLLRP